MILEILIGLILGYFLIIGYEKLIKLVNTKYKRNTILLIRNYHFHHSLYGILLLILFLFTKQVILFGLGIGIILRHTYNSKKFIFIDKFK